MDIKAFFKNLVTIIVISAIICSCGKYKRTTDSYNSPEPAYSPSYNYTPNQAGPRQQIVVTREATPDDAYSEGYDEGYEQGKSDGRNGYSHGYGYDDSSSYYDYYETRYQEGYEEGYDDGFSEGQSAYEDAQQDNDEESEIYW